jgi:hypothetical protein
MGNGNWQLFKTSLIKAQNAKKMYVYIRACFFKELVGSEKGEPCALRFNFS